MSVPDMLRLLSHRRIFARAACTATLSDRPSLKKRLSAGDRLYGAFLGSCSPVVAEILGYAGYDYVVVDMEHGPGGSHATLPILHALSGTPAHAIIRVQENSPVCIKKALDLGPSGVMVPAVDDAAAARMAVAAARYPPKGIRGAADSIIRASRFGLDRNYLRWCEEDLLVICQLESTSAAERVVEIAGTDGLDCLQMGPRDLQCSLGLMTAENGAEDTQAYIMQLEDTLLALPNRPFLAGIRTSQATPTDLFGRGYNLVAGVVDVALIRDAALADIAANGPLRK